MMPFKSIKITAALAIVLMLAVGIHYLMQGTTTKPTPSSDMQESRQLAETYYGDRNLPGLVDLLENGPEHIRIPVAEYLAQIGDESTLAALQRLADTWNGPVDSNPFKTAIESIESRLSTEPNEPNEPVIQIQSAAAPQAAVVAEPSPVLSGTGTHAAAGQPIKDLALQPACQVMLQVVDEAGQPLERVCVQALEAKIEPGTSLPNMGFTDSQGWVTLGAFEPSEVPITFSARLDGFAIGQTILTLTDPNQIKLSEIVLKKGLDVSGTAEYSDSVPAKGIQLSATPDWYHGVMMPERFSVDDQGRFVIQHILPGAYRISATPEMNPNDMGPIDSLLVYQTSLPLPDGETLTIRIPQASPGSQGSIKGHIVWGPGLEQPEQRPGELSIIATHATTDDRTYGTYPITDSNNFEIKPLTPGTYTLQINGRNIMPILQKGSVPGPDLEVRLYQAAPQPPARQSRFVQPEGPYGQIEGIVYDANGNPAPFVNVTIKPGAYMEVSSRGETWGGALTDANGLYRVESVPAGRICVVSRMERGSTSPGVIHRACVPAAHSTLHLDLGEGHTVTGTIQRNGMPLDHVDLRVTCPNSSSISDVFYCTSGTDDTGQFLIRGIPAGKYGIYYSNPEKRGQWLEAATLEVQDQDMDLGLIDIKTVRTPIQVFLSRANPAVDLSSWRVSIARGGKMIGNSVGQDQPYSESGLRFDLDDIPAGPYQVVTSSDHALINYGVPFTLNNPGEPITLQRTIPTGSATISGTVTPNNVFVMLWKDDGTVEATLFPREGFQIPGLPAGTYHLGVNACPGFPPLQIQSFQLAEAQSKTLDLDLSQWSPHHTVLIVSAADVRGPVLFASQSQLKGAQGIIQGQSNSSSRSIFLVPSGDYELTVQSEGYHEHTESIHLDDPKQQNPWAEKTVKIVRLTPN